MTFKQVALKNDELAKHLNENYICTYKQVSVFATSTHEKEVTREDSKKFVIKNGGNIASYFCDSSGRVMELIVGPVKPDRLRKCSDRAIKLNQKLRSASADEQKEIARKHYLNLCGTRAIDRVTFYLDTFRRLRLTPLSDTTLPEVVDITRATLFTMEEILDGYPHSWRDTRFADFPEVFPARRNQFDNNPGWQPERAQESEVDVLFKENLILAHRPLANIADIEQPVFQILVGQAYVVHSPAYRKKLDKFIRFTNEGKHILLILLDHPHPDRVEFRTPDVDQLINSKLITKQMDTFGVLAVKHDELFGIFSDMGYPPMSATAARNRRLKRGLGFVILEPNGEIVKELTSGLRDLKISREMRRATDD